MSVLNIKNCLDPALRKKCDLIQNIDEGLVTLSDDMIETMYAATGVGLAANQVGISSRLIAYFTASRTSLLSNGAVSARIGSV